MTSPQSANPQLISQEPIRFRLDRGDVCVDDLRKTWIYQELDITCIVWYVPNLRTFLVCKKSIGNVFWLENQPKPISTVAFCIQCMQCPRDFCFYLILSPFTCTAITLCSTLKHFSWYSSPPQLLWVMLTNIELIRIKIRETSDVCRPSTWPTSRVVNTINELMGEHHWNERTTLNNVGIL